MVSQFAPWISYTLKVFEHCKGVELHIIAPHEYISEKKEFCKDGVYYYFYNPYIPLWGRHWPGFFKWDKWTNYARNKRITRSWIDSIKPDVIHLQGAENPYYASSVLSLIRAYPVIVNLQRINLSVLAVGNHRTQVEYSILNTAKYFTVRTNTMYSDFYSYRPDSKIFMVNYAMPEYSPLGAVKEYDIVFFGQVCQAKGIEDLLDAMGIVSSQINPVSLCIIGQVNATYQEQLSQRVASFGLSVKLSWMGRLAKLGDVHKIASKAKISVLPTYNDIISGTIIESMQLGLPVVSYKTGSIPELNEDRENVLLSDRGDVVGLAKNILRLLTDDDLYRTMSQRGIECIKERYSNQNVLQQHLDCYREVIADFYKDEKQT